MGKRSDFKRRPQDAYDTPFEAVLPLVPHLPSLPFWFAEPCAGKGDLVEHVLRVAPMMSACKKPSDISPRADHVIERDALEIKGFDDVDFIITNPPWSREILHPMIEHFSAMRPTWLLFDADWAHTKQAAPYLKWCRKIVSVGRVKWIPDSPHTGKDNACWYNFDQHSLEPCEFVGGVAA